MYFQWLAATGVLVWKIRSIERGSSTAKRLVAASGTSGAGAKAIKSALVRLSTLRSVEKTINLRRDFLTNGGPIKEPCAFTQRRSSANRPGFFQEKSA